MDFKKRILEELNDTQKFTILLLASNNFEPVRGVLWFQKELFLLSNNFSNLEDETDFESDFMGPYSELATEALDQLKLYDVIELEDHKLKLTNLGKDIAKSIGEKVKQENKETISDLKSLLNDLSYDELFGFIYYNYPEMTKESIKFDKIKSKRKQIAMSLYEKGKVSIAKASEIAGASLENFIDELKINGIEVYSY